MRGVYKPIFERIFHLVEKQMCDLRTKLGKSLKVMIRFGRFSESSWCSLLEVWGITNILCIRWKRNSDPGLILNNLNMGTNLDGHRVMLTLSRYSAIMRGAILHKLGLNCIRERIMRRHYGVRHSRTPFNPAKDPLSRKGTNLRGDTVCLGAMTWYAKKVHTLSRWHIS